MPRRSKPAVDERIASLHREKRTQKQIATVLRREGVKITPSGVSRALTRMGLTAVQPSPKPAEVPIASPAEASVEHALEDADDLRAGVRRSIASLERAAARAEADTDVMQIVGAQKAVTSAMGLLARLTPEPPPDVNLMPDMIALRVEAARRWHELINMVADDMEREPH